MDRRDSIKSILLGSAAAGLAVHGCKPQGDSELDIPVTSDNAHFGRTAEELEHIAELNAETFFNAHELETLGKLCNLILPPEEPYGGPLDAGVLEFMEFMVKDIPEMQPTLRGGLMWLDHKCNKEFNLEFIAAEEAQQKQLLDEICYYDPEVYENERPLEIQFFSTVRNLTLTGYYTSELGIKALGYQGNQPNVWDGVPDEILEQHGVAYDSEWLAKCVDQSKRNVIAVWDDEGNLLT